MARKKTTRIVLFNSSLHSVYRSIETPGSYTVTYTVTLEDVADPDRPVKLNIKEDDAIRLASRLAALLGYKLQQD